MTEGTEYGQHHYVPKWYQYRFFDGTEKENKFYYLDRKPEVMRTKNGKYFTRNSTLRWGPPRCFFENDLYTTQFGKWKSTDIEKYFFGKIDSDGKNSIDYFADFDCTKIDSDAFHALLAYMSAQKLRTPKGLKYLKSVLRTTDKNEVLFKLQELYRMHCAIWTECVWSIVDACDSATKFICSDHPVTVYNEACFPASKWCRGSNDPPIWLNGTHTIFPLNQNKALLLTNLSWARDPYSNPLRERPNPELFRPAMFKFTDIQTGHKLSEQDVITINYIIKHRSYRYIAATNNDWLYPEKAMKKTQWDKITKPYTLMPDPRSMTFSSEIIVGYKDGTSDRTDEYGRKPWQDGFTDKERHDYEWNTFHAFKSEYARIFGPRRRGVAFNFGSKDNEVDSDDYHKSLLQQEHVYKRYIRQSKKRRKHKNKQYVGV